MDGNNTSTLQELVNHVYRGLKELKLQYFKVNALRYLRYEGFNSHAEFYQNKKIDIEELYRTFVNSIHNEIRNKNYMMDYSGFISTISIKPINSTIISFDIFYE